MTNLQKLRNPYAEILYEFDIFYTLLLKVVWRVEKYFSTIIIKSGISIVFFLVSTRQYESFPQNQINKVVN